MRFLLLIIILTLVFFVASPLAALWVAVAALLLRVLFALAGLLLKDQPGCGRSILVRTPVFMRWRCYTRSSWDSLPLLFSQQIY